MTETADEGDLFGGEGRPTDSQVLLVASYLKRHNRDAGVRPTQRELTARGFEISIATVQRVMAKAGVAAPQTKDIPAAEASHRVAIERKDNRRPKAEEPKVKLEDITLREADLVQKLTDLLEVANGSAKHSSTELAIIENRHRMALNVVIAQAMAQRPELLLLDMRGTAALVDALTCGSKLSGGYAIDIVRLPPGADQDQPPMKDVTPAKTTLMANLEEYRRKQRANGNGQGT